MGPRDILYAIVKLLNSFRVKYLLTGSFASSYYGIPRATHDIDLIIEIKSNQREKLLKTFDFLDKSFLVDKKLIQESFNQLKQFEIYHTDSAIKIDFWLIEKADFSQKYSHRQSTTIFSQIVSLISPEDLILNKLAWSKKVYSERHIQDCVGIVKVQGKRLDLQYLKHQAVNLDVINELKEILKKK